MSLYMKRLSLKTAARMEAMLVGAGYGRSSAALKADRGRVALESLLKVAGRLSLIRGLALPREALIGIGPPVIEKAAPARSRVERLGDAPSSARAPARPFACIPPEARGGAGRRPRSPGVRFSEDSDWVKAARSRRSHDGRSREEGGLAGARPSRWRGQAAAPRQRRMSARKKQEAVLRILRGEDLEVVSREVGTTAADLSAWRDGFRRPARRR